MAIMNDREWKLFKRLIDVSNRRGWNEKKWNRMVARWRARLNKVAKLPVQSL